MFGSVQFTDQLEVRVGDTVAATLTPAEALDLAEALTRRAFSRMLRETAEAEGWLPARPVHTRRRRQ